MKIAYLANVRFPSERAHTTQIAYMCQAFSSVGTEVVLFVNKRADDDLFKIANYYGLEPSFQIKRLSHGLYSYKSKIIFYFSELFFATNFLITSKRKQFDVIYSRHEWIVWFLSLFVAPPKLVWESHEAKLNFPARRLLKKRIKIVVISEGILEDYTQFGISTEQMLIAHDGIDESFFGPLNTKDAARARLNLPLEEKLAMYIGGFDGWKGIETFFAAADLVGDVRFVAIGGNVEQVTTFSKKYPKVLFLGQLPYADLKNNQQAADVLIIPNSGKTELSSRHTSPLKLFAHMASGVPIVASDLPSLATVTGCELVTFVPADNPEALAKGIADVFAHYDVKKALAQELKAVSLRYTWNERAKSIINFIK